MRFRGWLLTGILSYLFVACTVEDVSEEGILAQEIQFSTSILPRHKTRAQIAEDGSGVFAQGDKIQLFVRPSYAYSPSERTLNFSDGKWLPRMSWEEWPNTEVGFSAFHPALTQDSRTGKSVHSISYDQHTGQNYEKSDLLFARQRAAYGETVNLEFRHLMSRLTVELKSKTYTADELAQAAVYVWTMPQVEVDRETGSLGNLKFAERQTRLKSFGGGCFRAILCPSEIFDEWRDKYKGWIGISFKGNFKVIPAPETLADGSVFDRVEPGKDIHVTFNIDKDNIELWANQTHWVYGLKNPPLEDHQKWGYAFVAPQDPTFRYIGLTWKPEYGWFDCNKKDPYGPSAHDQNMCWAASSSNLIHWWLEQNKGYLKRYGKYDGPHNYPNSLESEVFQLFKDNFKDEGFQPPKAINWFFNGYMGIEYKPGAGFFTEVFGTGPMVDVEDFTFGRPNIEKAFADVLKTAFRGKKAITFSFYLHKEQDAHAVTLWGAEFDEQGIVRALYMSDNNDREWEDYVPDMQLDRPCVATGLYRRPIDYKDGFVYLESGVKNAFTLKIGQLVFLDLHQDQWESYLKSVGK